jgi:hypothetical protein
MSLDIKNLSHVEQDVGQHIKSTKKHFVWEFLLDGRPHKIELYDSRVSGKKKLIKDGQIFKEVEGDVAFNKTFEIGKHSCTIIQHGEKYELRIDNQSFSHMMDLERNRVYFSNFNPTSNTYSNKPVNISNNISFGMGQVNPQAQTQKSGSLFNFSIKPTNVNTQKRMSEVPSHDFNVNKLNNFKESKDYRDEQVNNSNTRSQSVLLEFDNPILSESNKKKENTMDILGSIDFLNTNTNYPITNTNVEENTNIFDLTR